MAGTGAEKVYSEQWQKVWGNTTHKSGEGHGGGQCGARWASENVRMCEREVMGNRLFEGKGFFHFFFISFEKV